MYPEVKFRQIQISPRTNGWATSQHDGMRGAWRYQRAAPLVTRITRWNWWHFKTQTTGTPCPMFLEVIKTIWNYEHELKCSQSLSSIFIPLHPIPILHGTWWKFCSAQRGFLLQDLGDHLIGKQLPQEFMQIFTCEISSPSRVFAAHSSRVSGLIWCIQLPKCHSVNPKFLWC